MSTGRAEPSAGPRILYAGSEAERARYLALLPEAFAAEGMVADLVTEAAPDTVDYIIYAPNGPLDDFSPFTRARAVLGLWAGVEQIVTNPTLTQPLARMVDPGLTQGMVEWVAGHVLRYHLDLDLHLLHQDGVWRDHAVPPLAADRRVGILGLGALGSACGQALARLGFSVSGWARTPKTIEAIACHHGPEGLDEVLSKSEILVLLLPLTAQTENLIDAARLARLPRGAVVINPGRGPLIDDAALLGALESGHVSHATLDVFRAEPLPPDHPYWAHPAVTVTPHIASATRAATAARSIAQNIARVESGLPLLNRVDRDAGY